jgi:hypothetical protein
MIPSSTFFSGNVQVSTNMNGMPSKQDVSWNGSVLEKGNGKATVDLSTDMNGAKNELHLKNVDSDKIMFDKRTRSFLTKLQRSKKPGKRRATRVKKNIKMKRRL